MHMSLEDLRGRAHKRLFACGSMVLAVLSVRPEGTRFLRSASEKTKHKRKVKYRCERLHLSYRVTRVSYRTYAVALSNAALPAAAWYFPTVVRFFALRAKKRITKRRLKYRCEYPHLGTA